jgi:phage-related protein
MVYLSLTDDNGSSYAFPQTFFIKRPALSASTNILKYMYADGGKQVGDGRYNHRVITVEGAIIEDTLAAFETSYQAMCLAALKGGVLRIIGDAVDRYIEVRTPDIDCEDEIYGASVKVTLTFIAAYPFWQDTNLTTTTTVMAGAGSITITGTGSVYIMTPVITIAADQGVDVPGIKLLNTNDGGLNLTYNNPYFYAGATLVIDCGAGTIRLNNNNAIEYLQAGSALLRLQPMSNVINYEGAACTISVAFRKVYL